MKITPNRGNNPCVCGAIHPCCRFLVDGHCPHRTPGRHHHAPETSPTDQNLVAKVRAAIYAELNAQHEADEIDGAGYWDDEWGRLDGEPNWDRIAAAAITAVRHADAETA